MGWRRPGPLDRGTTLSRTWQAASSLAASQEALEHGQVAERGASRVAGPGVLPRETTVLTRVLAAGLASPRLAEDKPTLELFYSTPEKNAPFGPLLKCVLWLRSLSICCC